MTDEDILQEAMSTAEDAKKLLENPIISGFLIAMKGDLLSKFNRTTITQDKERNEIWRMTKVVEEFEDNLQNYIDNGKIAKATFLEDFGDKVKSIL